MTIGSFGAPFARAPANTPQHQLAGLKAALAGQIMWGVGNKTTPLPQPPPIPRGQA